MSKIVRIAEVTLEEAKSTMSYLEHEDKLDRQVGTGCVVPRTSKVRDYSQASIHVHNTQMKVKRGKSKKAFIPKEGNVRVMVHQIAYLARYNKRPAEGEDVSHLCHNSLCCNAEHLTIESHAINMDRKACIGTIHAALPCVCDPKCQELHMNEMRFCNHQPACLHERHY